MRRSPALLAPLLLALASCAVMDAEDCARATPDGHTLGLLGSTLATNPPMNIQKNGGLSW